MSDAKRDGNFVPTLIATSSSDGVTPVLVYADPTTHRLYVDIPGGAGTVTSVSVVTANGISGSVANPTSTPAITLTLGAITPTTVNGLTISTTTGTLTITNGKTLSVSNILTFTGTDSSTVAFGAGGTVLYANQSITLSGDVTGSGSTAITTTVAKIAGTTVSGTTGSTNVVFSTSPVLVTPTLGVASATSLATSAASPLLLTNGQLVTVALTSQTVGATTLTIPNFASVVDEFVFKTKSVTMSNKTFVAPVLGAATATSINGLTITSTTGTLTITNGKTLSISNILTLAGTDSTTMTFPGASDTIGGLGTAQTWTAQNKFNNIVDVNNAIAASGNAATVPVTFRLSTVTNNSAATLTITITTASAVDGQMLIVRILDSSAAAQTITWVNTENSTVSAPTTSNGSTTLFLTVGFIYNGGTSKWRCIASA